MPDGPEQINKLMCRKCPNDDLAFSPHDKPTLWLIQIDGDPDGYVGQVGVTLGRHAESLARMFAAAPKLLACAECEQARDDYRTGAKSYDEVRAVMHRHLNPEELDRIGIVDLLARLRGEAIRAATGEVG